MACAWRPRSEHGKPFSQPTRVCSVDYGILPYFHFSLSSSFLVTVLAFCFGVPFSTPILHIIFSFLLWLHSIFLILFFGSPFYSPILWKNPLHVSLFFLFSLFFFSFSPNLLPFHSIGTREVVTQKNPERPGACPRLKARPQPPLFYPFTCSEPQFTDCVALSEHSI